ncbi:Tetratricopeptide repeat-containing protein [Porphyromonadaceae bacterium NLAE-zl-C104]|nr:Tetratricopeptide repeat-containing protein [Porphyromonadaceae bacterium NLAE-zl-C104]
MKIRTLLTAICFLCIFFTAYPQAKVLLEEKTVILPTYPVAPSEKAPIFFRNEAYQGASRHYYPLKLNDQYTHERIEEPWNFVVLGNEFVEVGILPEIGGKLYYATDKTNEYNYIYKNNVVKPSNIGMTGAWVSGGIEWCIPHHHRASTYLPMNYTTTINDDGSKTVWIGEHEPRHGMRWTIGVTLFPDRSYFKVKGRIFNATPLTHTFLYWANVATHTNENYQTIFPPSAQVVTFHSKTDFARWPVSREIFRGADFTEGVDISWWKNVKESNSFFVHDLREDFMGGYDHGKDAGTVHIGDHNIVKGAKLWEWGSGQRGQATEAVLTENDGPYVEIMVGAYSDNQPDYSWIRPYEVKEWEQYWYPVKGIKGFKNANLNGAVNLEKREKNNVFLGYYSTQKIDRAKVILKNKNDIVFEKEISISPDNPFSETISLKVPFNIESLYTELIDSGHNVLISYQPVKLEENQELPEPWKGYTPPAQLYTVEELYLTGRRVEQFYAPQHDPMDWYMEALRRDPGDIRSNTAVGNIYLKNGDYKNARIYFSKAIARLTGDYTRPDNCEPLYLQGLTLRALGMFDEARDTLYRATWNYSYHSPAYFQLAQLSSATGDYEKALFEVNQSLSTNNKDNRAIALKASLLRKLEKTEEALLTIRPILTIDPLDFRIRNEYYLLLKGQENEQKVSEVLATLEKEMRHFDDNYLELAVGYLNDGLLKEAEDILLRYSGKNPFFDYYLGYIHDKQGKAVEANNYFSKAAEYSVDYIFPYRLESIGVLKKAIEYNPNDGKAYYFLGNILYEKQPEVAMEYWDKASKLAPGLSIVYRNLGWGYYYFYNDIDRSILHYEKAVNINKNEPIYYSELDALYVQNNTPIATRLKLFEGNEEIVKHRDDAFIRLIDVLTLAGKPERAVQLLDGAQFSYREGTSNVRDLIINAQLMTGLIYFNNQEYEKALGYFLKSQIQEEEAGSARLGNRDIQINYYIAQAYTALNKHDEAEKYYNKTISLPSGRINIMNYYKGLSYTSLGDKTNAERTFDAMVAEANKRIENIDKSEVGTIFGRREAENMQRSLNYTIRGLGYKGLKQADKAENDLKMALEYSNNNLWAKVEMEM